MFIIGYYEGGVILLLPKGGIEKQLVMGGNE